MGLTVVLIFPVGAMSWKLFDRIFGPRILLLIHIAFQILGLALLVTGFGLGVWVAVLHDEVRILNSLSNVAEIGKDLG